MGQASDPKHGLAGSEGDGGARGSQNLVGKAVRGAFWMILSGVGARMFGILGTLAVTRYLNPDEYGEVSLAVLIIQIANLLTNGGLSQYLAARPKAGRDVVFHATFYYTLIGLVGLGLAVLFGPQIGGWLHAPRMVKHLPAIAIACIFDRIAVIQDRIQLRALRFRSVGVQRALGELTYTGVSVGLAAFASGTPYGGANAIVWGTLARGVLRTITLSFTTPRREWLSPSRLRWDTTKELFSFGLPMAIVTIAGLGSQRFDNLVFQFHFGLAWLVFYNLAYNFADIPASLVSEQLGDVLVPSFAHMEDDVQRRNGLLLSLRMMILVVTPAAVGIGLIAPTLSKVAFDPRYQEGITRILQILAMFAMARTITWVCNSYLQVRNQARTIMYLEIARMVAVVVVMNAFILLGKHLYGKGHAVRWACISVVVVFSLSALSYMLVIRRLDRVTLRDQILPLLPPLVACVPMAVAVIGMRRTFTRLGLFMLHHTPINTAEQVRFFGPRLFLEVLVGGLVFIPSALILAPAASREFLGLIRGAIAKRRGRPSSAPPEPA